MHIYPFIRTVTITISIHGWLILQIYYYYIEISKSLIFESTSFHIHPFADTSTETSWIEELIARFIYLISSRSGAYFLPRGRMPLHRRSCQETIEATNYYLHTIMRNVSYNFFINKFLLEKCTTGSTIFRLRRKQLFLNDVFDSHYT